MTPTTPEALLVDLREVIVQMLIEERVLDPDDAPEMRGQLEATFVPDTALPDLGWDSIQFPALLVRAEDRYGIDTSDLSVFDVFTVEDLLNELGKRIEGFAS